MVGPGLLDELPILARDNDAGLSGRPETEDGVLRPAVTVVLPAWVVVVETFSVAGALEGFEQDAGVLGHGRATCGVLRSASQTWQRTPSAYTPVVSVFLRYSMAGMSRGSGGFRRQ